MVIHTFDRVSSKRLQNFVTISLYYYLKLERDQNMDVIRIGDFNNYKISDSDIVRRVLFGEKELYEILLRRNNQKLYRVIKGYISDDVEIQDIMQNTYLKAFEKLYQFKHDSAYGTWLIRIGINEALVRLKEKGKMLNLNERASNLDANVILEMPDIDQLNPEKRIIREEVKQLLENTIDSLEPKYRSVYILREIEEMSINEIAACLDISASNVKVRLHRAKSMLKVNLYKTAIVSDHIFEFGNNRCDNITDRVMQMIL